VPKVSVIIPAHNAARFVTETIESVLHQTYRDLEVIVVDDGSTDETVQVLRAFKDRIVLRSQPNGGVARARNAGARIATGEWLAFLDADDLWLPEKLERQLELADAGTAWIYSDRFNFGSLGDGPEIQSEITTMHEGDVFTALLAEGNFISSSTVIVRKEIFDRVGGYCENLRGTEDWDLWIRVSERNSIRFCPRPLLRYRIHSAGISHNYDHMWRERRMVVARALALPRGKTFGWSMRRRIWSETWITNGVEAVRSGRVVAAFREFGRAVVAWPIGATPYREIIRLGLCQIPQGRRLVEAIQRLRAARKIGSVA
jgi:glycosyltransferase involved in cell wall biosynthesis